MREYRHHTVQKLAACTCDRCGRRLVPDDGEWQERLSFDHSCGFDSVFGDGNTVGLDLCQHCVREVLGQWLRITPPADADGPTALAQAMMSVPNVGEDADFARHPGLEKSAEFGANFMAEGRGKHAQTERGKTARRLTALKGSIWKPAKPVSVEDMGMAIAKEAGKAARRLGGLKGRIRMKHGFDAPLSLSGKKKPKKRP
ncbi:hypothetical protein ACI2VA_08605 [Ralstonia nicotianae]